MTGALAVLVVLGVGVAVHSVHVIATARPEPAPFSAASSAAAPVGASRPAASVPPRRNRPERAGQFAFVATRLRIPALHVDAHVEAVLSEEHTLLPPGDPSQVGWWVASALPGSTTGSTVIVGHIDSASAGPGALFHLADITAGQTIELSTGTTNVRYRTTSLHFYPKVAGLPATLFDPSGAARLVLVSCGGTFDAAKHSYRANVVVTAVPAR